MYRLSFPFPLSLSFLSLSLPCYPPLPSLSFPGVWEESPSWRGSGLHRSKFRKFTVRLGEFCCILAATNLCLSSCCFREYFCQRWGGMAGYLLPPPPLWNTSLVAKLLTGKRTAESVWKKSGRRTCQLAEDHRNDIPVKATAENVVLSMTKTPDDWRIMTSCGRR